MISLRAFLALALTTLCLCMAVVQSRPAVNEGQVPEVMCRLPVVRGHCRALLPRWRYDPDTGKCYEFKFGGCDGNGNNFMSQKACMGTCGGVR